MEKKSFVWKVAGAAGEGIMATGQLLSKTCARHGLYIFDYNEYPSLIKGGHNTYQVHASSNPVYSQRLKVDILIALNLDTIEINRDELIQNSILIYDKENDKIDIEKYNLSTKTIDLPMVRLAKEAGAKELMGNNVGLGASCYLLGLDLSILSDLIAEVFKDKGQEVVSLNQKAAASGYNYVSKLTPPHLSVPKQAREILTISGNEALALGALAGGLQFYAAYPMSPSSSILHFLAEKAPQATIVVKHAEDEISAVNMAMGASFAGVRAMVGTSGGGFCYMVEALGLAGIAELPIVIVEAMRPGPALGLPTWTAQGDLKFVISASQGEFPRFVLAAADATDAFELARYALELTEKYQTPVILLSDKYLSEGRQTLHLTTPIFNNQRHNIASKAQPDQSGFFPRYQLTETGISPRTLPGTVGGYHLTNSYAHNQYGLSAEEADVTKKQTDKRFQKQSSMEKEVPQQFWEEEPGSQITFISFGTTKGPIREARGELKREGIATNMLNLSWLWPFPINQVMQAIEGSANVIVVEGNYQGQLADLITQETGIIIKNRLNRYDGRPFYPEEIVEYVKNFKGGN